MSEQSLLHRCPVVPVVVIQDVAHALPLGEALLAGGITIAEITLRTEAGIHAIEILAKELPELYVGAGSVLVADHVDQVVDAGAQFVVSPGLSGDVLTRSRQRGVPRPARRRNILRTHDGGRPRPDRGEILPRRSARRPSRDPSAFSAPFTTTSFMPSGGVNADNMTDYLAIGAVPAVAAAGGSTPFSSPRVVGPRSPPDPQQRSGRRTPPAPDQLPERAGSNHLTLPIAEGTGSP